VKVFLSPSREGRGRGTNCAHESHERTDARRDARNWKRRERETGDSFAGSDRGRFLPGEGARAWEQFAIMLSRVNSQLPRVHPNSRAWCKSIKVVPIFRTVSPISLLRLQAAHSNAALRKSFDVRGQIAVSLCDSPFSAGTII